MQHLSQWEHISLALSAFGIILLVSNVCAIALLVCVGVNGCGWPSSTSIWRIEMAVFALMNRAPNSIFAMDDTTSWIIFKILRMAPLLKGVYPFWP